MATYSVGISRPRGGIGVKTRNRVRSRIGSPEGVIYKLPSPLYWMVGRVLTIRLDLLGVNWGDRIDIFSVARKTPQAEATNYPNLWVFDDKWQWAPLMKVPLATTSESTTKTFTVQIPSKPEGAGVLYVAVDATDNALGSADLLEFEVSHFPAGVPAPTVGVNLKEVYRLPAPLLNRTESRILTLPLEPLGVKWGDKLTIETVTGQTPANAGNRVAHLWVIDGNWKWVGYFSHKFSATTTAIRYTYYVTLPTKPEGAGVLYLLLDADGTTGGVDIRELVVLVEVPEAVAPPAEATEEEIKRLQAERDRLRAELEAKAAILTTLKATLGVTPTPEQAKVIAELTVVIANLQNRIIEYTGEIAQIKTELIRRGVKVEGLGRLYRR